MFEIQFILAILIDNVPGPFSSEHRKPYPFIRYVLWVRAFSIDRAITIGQKWLSALNDTGMTTVSGGGIHNCVPFEINGRICIQVFEAARLSQCLPRPFDTTVYYSCKQFYIVGTPQGNLAM